ncbi:MAG: PAS domain S-box protein [Steroidobacteraceae bacterium]
MTITVLPSEILSNVLDSAPDAMMVVDASGSIVFLNRQVSTLFGFEASEVKGQRIEMLLPERFRGLHVQHCRGFVANGRRRPMGIGLKLFALRKDGTEFPVEVSLSPIADETGVLIIAAIRDLTERKRAEAALRASEAHLRTIVETEPDCVQVVSPDGQLLELNAAGLAMFEVDSIEQANEHGPLNFVCPEYRTAICDMHQGVMGGARGELEFAIVGLKRTRRWLQCHSAPMRDTTGAVVARLAIVRDITERKQLESALLTASNREQQRLGHELHDGLGQDLTGIALLAAALGSSASQGKGPSADELLQLATMTGHAIATCRAIARGLTPVSDGNGGLVQALSDMVTQQRDSHRVEVRFAAIAAAPIHLRADVQDHLYRIAQEAVTNAQKHGHAGLINVTLDIQPALVRLEVLDNGVGLVPAAAPSTGLGLKIMRYRAAMIGAQLSIGPGHPGGTVVVCQCSQPE